VASRIKGITVEIGGDTTGLDKALKGRHAIPVQFQIAGTHSAIETAGIEMKNRIFRVGGESTRSILFSFRR